MDYKAWIENVEGWASLYAFDIMPDGSFGEIRFMAYNSQNMFMQLQTEGAPEFYPGIPYREYFTDLNFEKFVYSCASRHEPLYSYVNTRGGWLKGMYLSVTEPGTVSAQVAEEMQKEENKDKPKTVYCLYVATFSPELDLDNIAKRSSEVSNAVLDISMKLHETRDFYQGMAAAAKEIREFCGAEKCSLYIVDKSNQKCRFINEDGNKEELLEGLAVQMGRTPFEVALKWEEDLQQSDCLILDDLSIIKERDAEWYDSLIRHNIRNIVLFAVRFNQMLVGFIWAANYDTEKMMMIKETLEKASFIIAAVIANHQLVSQLEEKSAIDGLTQVYNRNSMNERVDGYMSGKTKLPETMGIVFTDLNGLKTVNDEKGHDAGDKLLSRAAALLKIAFGDEEIYRSGGDEFVIFCPDMPKEQVEAQISQLRALTDSTNDVRFAIGTVFCSGEYDLFRAMQAADEDMYRDKEEYYRRHPELNRRRQIKE